MDPKRTEPQSSYKIITMRGDKLPDQYVGFVVVNFLRNLRNSNTYFKLIEREAYWSHYNRYFHSLLLRPNAILKIAVLADDPDVTLGWSLMEPDILHYVFVQADYRKLGIAKKLVPEFKYMTHLTLIGMSIWASKYKKVQFNPFL